MQKFFFLIAFVLVQMFLLGDPSDCRGQLFPRAGHGRTSISVKPSSSQPVGDEEEKKSWVILFDGNTLQGWEGNKKFFRVEDRSIVAGSLNSKIPHNEFLCTQKSYDNFELRLKAKLVGAGKNAGIQFRSQRIANHHEVIGYQCDMGQMNGHSIWGYLYDESRRRKFLVEADPEKTDRNTKFEDWNDLVVRCQGHHVKIWVNGFQTVDYLEKDKKIAKSGIIGLQIHSGPPAEAWYRDIKIKPLD
jgi:hypothetical protein